MERKQEYIKTYMKKAENPDVEKYNKENVETFFTDLQKSYDKLEKFAEVLLDVLEHGNDVIVSIKGYTSPLHNVEYNEKLAKRRIACIMNYLYTWRGGILNQFEEHQPKTGKGYLKYVFIPLGEIKPENVFLKKGQKIDKDILKKLEKDKIEAVYSPAASYMRRIVIENIQFDDFEDLNQEIKTILQTQKITKEEEEELLREIRDSSEYQDETETQE